MNAYARAISLLERTDLDHRAIVFEVARLAPAVLVRAVGRTARGLEGEVRALLKADQYINAIKLYRTSTGAGLKEAKDAVDAMRDEMGLTPMRAA